MAYRATSAAEPRPQGAGSALSGTEPCHAFTGIEGVALYHWPPARRQVPDPTVNNRSVIQ
jgi:hypothetical protein